MIRQAWTLWPRRSPGLPPGQRALAVFPRFSHNPKRPPPQVADAASLILQAAGLDDRIVTTQELDRLEQREQRSDFHCVTTWSHRDVRWGGIPISVLWNDIVEPWLGALAPGGFALATGADRYQAMFHQIDLLGDDVLLARTIDGAPLDAVHGAPLRLVSPSQYGYKSVKHLVSLELRTAEPPGRLGPKEHPRARVADEERHRRIPGPVLRLPYRALVPLTALLAERSALNPQATRVTTETSRTA